ncbi:MAG: hypothetical protein H7A37_09880 [Chlamydiales bacterium]|nr:hypothetical protein [Chlamydiia bacterium]MCP5508585.1 hypothetical protein [Chlamydiales bacterium]
MRISELERIGRIAAAFEARMQDLGNITVAEATDNELLKEARVFLKSVKKEYREDPRVQACAKQLNASRLGVTPEALDASPGFETFAVENILYRYLYIYNDELRIDEESAHVWIKHKGDYVPWRNVRKIVEIPPPPMKEDYPVQRWVYDQYGLINKDMYNWEKVIPFKHGNPADWGHRTFFVFCASRPMGPALAGLHSWFRIMRSDGTIYSIGKYRPEKQKLTDHLKQPFRVKRGYIMCPDVSEFYPMPVKETRIEITEEQADTIIAAVEERKRNEENEHFHNLLRNCTVFDNEMAELAGVRLPTRQRIWRVITPDWFQRFIDAIDPYTPRFIHNFFDRMTAFFINLIGYVFLGATQVDASLSEGDALPHITCFSDLFDPEKASIHHPDTLTDLIHKIDTWREQERRHLETEKRWYEKGRTTENSEEVDLAIAQLDKQLNAVDGAIPDEYRLKHQ